MSRPKEGGTKDRLAHLETAVGQLADRVAMLEAHHTAADPRVDALQASALQDARGTADTTVPHGHHTADGPAGCPKCDLLREAQ